LHTSDDNKMRDPATADESARYLFHNS